MTTRRNFVKILPLAGTTFAAGTLLASRAWAADAPMVNEKDPQAVGLGYMADGSKVDKTKFPKYTPDQACNNCQLYQGKPTDPAGPCAIFPGKAVAAKGWCSAHVKKA